MTDVPVEPAGAQWIPEDSPAPVVADVEAGKPEFERVGSPSLEDYVEGLRHEFALATDEARAAIKAELDRVTGRKSLETADAPKAPEVA